MRKFVALFLLLSTFIVHESMSQCTNCDVNFPGGNFTTNTSTLTTVSTIIYGGDYAYYDVVAGETYTWTTCGDADFDTQLTLFDGMGCAGAVLGYNDDDCGVQSTITWVATFTGTVTLLVSEYNCLSNSTGMTVQWACLTCGAAPDILVTGCTGNFYDLGGAAGNYSNNETQVWTFCPDNPGSLISLDFTLWDVEPGGNFDILNIYDGNSTAAPWVVAGDGLNPLGGVVQATPGNLTGCLTFEWTSDGSGAYPGWAATISCYDPCQDIVAVWDGSTPAAVYDAGDGAWYIDICPGETVAFNAHGDYPENGTSYAQSDASSTFTWDFDDGSTGTGTSVSHTYMNEGGYDVDLQIEDINGCLNTNDIGVRVRVATAPVFAGTTASDFDICIGECTDLTGVATPQTWQYPSSQTLAGTTFLPDGSGVSYSTGLTFDDFSPGQTVTTVNDVVEICINIEHSYVGDLDMYIECPNGQTMVLFDTYNGTGSLQYLGEPTDFSSNQGVGYEYCFSPTSTNGTFVDLITAGAPTYDYVDNDGNTVTAHQYIPAGEYEAEGNWANLIGCPLNGTWTIVVTDNISADDGYIFSWGIGFDPSLYPTMWDFTPTIVSENWTGNGAGPGNPSNACPTSTGAQVYTYTVTDNFGCTYDTTLTINVTSLNITTAFADASCNGGADGTATVTGAGGGTAPYTYTWSPNVSSTNSATGLSAGTYDVTVEDANGCQALHSFTISEPAAMSFTTSSTPEDCGACDGTATVNGITGGTGPFTYQWDAATGNQTSNPATALCAGTYNVTVEDANGCTATNSATVTGSGTVTAGFTYNGNQCLNGGANNYCFTNTGTTGVTYDWDFGDGPGTSTDENPCYAYTSTGTFTVTQTVIDGACTDVATMLITVYDHPTVTFTTTDVTCNGFCNGTATANPVGGSGTYTYQWDAGAANQTTQTATALCAGTYDVTINDSYGCSVTGSATINEPPAINLVAASSNVVCNGACDGTAQVTPSGGSGGYTYLWTGGPTTQNITNLCPGTYTVSVYDVLDPTCFQTETVVITEPAAIVLSGSAVDATCGLTNGSATVTVTSGGIAPFDYLWDAAAGSQTTATASGLGAGAYQVTVTDDTGCTAMTTVNVNDLGSPTATITLTTDVTCNGDCDGTATVTLGGTLNPNFDYQWSNGTNNMGTPATSDNVSGLCAGPFSVTITDSNGCVATASGTINEPTAVTATTTAVDANCGQADGSATANPSGGTGPYTYQWDVAAGSQITQTATALSAATYSVTVYDAAMCPFVTTATVNDIGGITSVATASTDVICNGDATGTATATPSGGTPPYDYLWDVAAGSQITQTATALAAGTYSVTIEDDNGCLFSTTVTVSEPAAVTATITGTTDALCFGSFDGTATVAGGGGIPPYTVLWDAGATPTAFTNTGLGAGTVNVVVTDAVGCTANTSAVIGEPAALVLTTSHVDENCNQCNGTATVSVTGGINPYTYIWPVSAGSQTTPTATNLCTGSYDVTVTDANGCTATDNEAVSNIPAGTATISSFINVSCFGTCDGEATVSIGGGTAPYTYLWPVAAGSQTTATATNLCPGVYEVSTTDDVGCVVTATVTITEPAQLTGTLSIDHLTCFDICDGQITANPTGGTAPVTYAWDGMLETTQTVTNLCPGNYTVTMTDDNGCSFVESGTVLNADSIEITGVITDANCGMADGEIDITVTGGTPAYTYWWITTTTPTDEDQTGLAANTYTVVITDSKGCTNQQDFIVGDIDGPSSAITLDNNVSCNGDCDGMATAIGSGGSGSYSYQWSVSAAGQLNATATNLCAGIHDVTVTDVSNGCISVSSVTITEPAVLDYTLTFVDPECNSIYGACNGYATTTVVGGTTPYSYQWSGPGLGLPDTLANVNDLCAGIYSILVTDANGCTNLQNFSLTEPPFINLTFSTIDEQCSGACDGQATVNPSGGTGTAYTFQWDSNASDQTTQTAIGLCSGTYSVTVYDENSCPQDGTVNIQTPNPMSFVSVIITDVDCYGNCNGTVTTNVTGGTPPYTFNWSHGSGDQNPTGLCQGVYNVTVYDDNGCFIDTTLIINQPPELLLTLIPADETCYNYNDGSITTNIVGGQPPYDVIWSPGGMTTPSLTNIGDGTYCITVTDFNGCSLTACETINGPDPLEIVNVITQDATCGNNNGSISISIAGGIPGYDILWDTGSPSTNLLNITSGCYDVTVTDANTCSVDTTICINNIDGPVINSISVTDITCYGYDDGTALVDFTAVPTASILWSDGQTTSLATGLTPGNHEVTVTDGNNCDVSQTIFVNEPPQLNASITSFTDVLCNGDCNGTATVTTGGGIMPHTYNWPVTGGSAATDNGLCAGTHSVIVTDANGCTATDNQLISQPDPFTVSETITDVTCNGENDGIITVVSSGGTVPHSYNWLNSGTTISTDANLTPGTHTVCITDLNSCDTCLTYTVVEPTPIVATLASDDATCEMANGSIYVSSVSGGTSPYNYVWSPSFDLSAAGDTNSMAPDGTYMLTVYDDNNCDEIFTGDILDIPPPYIEKIDVYDASCYGFADGWADADVAGGTAPYTYNWQPSGGSSDIATNLAAGSYTLYVTDASGCETNGTILVEQPGAVNLVTSGEITICIGQSTVLTAYANGGTPPYNYDFNGFLTSSSSYVVSPDTLTCYTITATDANGCPNVQPQQECVDVYPAIDVEASTTTPIICEGESASLNGTASGGNGGPYDYYWSGTSDHSSSVSVSPYSTTTYIVYAMDDCGSPSDSAQVTITVDYAPPIAMVPDTSGCEPITVTFDNLIPDETGVSYVWNFDDPSSGTSNYSTSPDPSHTFNYAGIYDITLTVSSSNGCENTQTYDNLIRVNPVPDADFYANPWVTSLFHSRVEFYDQSSEEVTNWHWDFGDGSNSIETSPEHVFDEAATYNVWLYVETEFGCKDSVLHEVIIQEEVTFYAPTAITPGNGGRNQEFIPKGVGIDESTYQIWIYDRWGEVIYQSDDYNDHWNGRFRNKGDYVELGTYTWLVRLRDVNGQDHEYSGSVTVIR